MSKAYIIYSEEQWAKVGNTIIYLTDEIGPLSKTKILKLLYILEEFSITRSGIPFFNLTFKVWQYGPVSEEVFVDLSSSQPSKLKGFIRAIEGPNSNALFEPLSDFNDDEFSEFDIRLMDEVIDLFGNQTAKDLIKYTHREQGLWYTTANNNDVLELLLDESVSNTEIKLDLSLLIKHDDWKHEMYQDYITSQ